MAHDVFISHSSKDKTIADAVCAAIEAAKIRCWIAPRDIMPGEKWAGAITKAISSSRIMVLIFSENSNNSEDVLNELQLAKDAGAIIIPLNIGYILPKGEMGYYLNRTHWLDAMNPPTKKQLQELVETASRILKVETVDMDIKSKIKKEDNEELIPDILSKDTISQQNQFGTKKCTFCEKEILADAIKCKYCHQWLNKQTDLQTSSEQIPTKKQDEINKIPIEKLNPKDIIDSSRLLIPGYSNAQPIWHLIILSILTFGLYQIYWFYRNWKHLKINNHLDISPGWRTAGLLVPIYGFVLAYRQLREIRDFSKEVGVDKTYSPEWIIIVWIIVTSFILLPNQYSFIFVLSVGAILMVQGVLNSYWKKEQPALIERTNFSGREIAIAVIGEIFWIILITNEM
ncbi:MAG: TIR domain-containing protein [Candidatus Methanoperedens sp.]|nr:TIR domain-containing protein [Candidatus Methanoperedens sp.]